MWQHTLPLKQQVRRILRLWGVRELVAVASVLKALGSTVASRKTNHGSTHLHCKE